MGPKPADFLRKVYSRLFFCLIPFQKCFILLPPEGILIMFASIAGASEKSDNSVMKKPGISVLPG